MKKFIAIFITTFAILFVAFYCSYYNSVIYDLQDYTILNYNQIENYNNNTLIGKIIKIDAPEMVECSNDKLYNEIKISQRFLNIVSVKKNTIKVPLSQIQVCGNAVGVTLNSVGIVVSGFSGVHTNKGIVYPLKNSNIKIGDQILEINNNLVNTSDEIDLYVNELKNIQDGVKIKYQRKGKIMYDTIYPAKDTSTNMYKLGIWIKENLNGIGTLTYINPKNNRFGSLGHGICERDGDDTLEIIGGNLYSCKIEGINKAGRGSTGELCGSFNKIIDEQGVIDKNNDFGIYGYVDEKSEFIGERLVEIGGRTIAKPGKAKIYCCLDGKSVKGYDIEILKTKAQNKEAQKGMIIKIVDKKLISKTGGIVQGMSGSPIIQDNHLVGAVTHVLVNDPTKGFGIYLDWMLKQ